MTDNGDDSDGGYIEKSELLRDIKIHASTLDEWVKTGRFPEPVVLNPDAGREIVRWRKGDVRAWKDSRPQRQAKPISEAAYKKARSKRKPMLRRPTK